MMQIVWLQEDDDSSFDLQVRLLKTCRVVFGNLTSLEKTKLMHRDIRKLKGDKRWMKNRDNSRTNFKMNKF